MAHEALAAQALTMHLTSRCNIILKLSRNVLEEGKGKGSISEHEVQRLYQLTGSAESRRRDQIFVFFIITIPLLEKRKLKMDNVISS